MLQFLASLIKMSNKQFRCRFKMDQIFSFRSSSGKRKYKDQKFGYGGKKSGMKWNTKDSYNDVSSFRAKVAHNKGNKGGKKGKGGKQNVSHRLRPPSLFTCTCEGLISDENAANIHSVPFSETPRKVCSPEDEGSLVTAGKEGPKSWTLVGLPAGLSFHFISKHTRSPRGERELYLDSFWCRYCLQYECGSMWKAWGGAGPAGLLRNQWGKGCPEEWWSPQLTLESSPNHHFL